MGPGAEPFNWGNVLWHELGHVFAIQQSKNHVPRWFTEGLSEYETIARRPEWQREMDPELYVALAHNRLPGAVDMNRVFSAYYKTKDAESKINDARGGAKKELDERMTTYKANLDSINKLNQELGVDTVKVRNVDTDKSEFPQRYDPSHPAADEKGYVRTPNVN